MFFPYFPSFRPITPYSQLEMQEKPKMTSMHRQIHTELDTIAEELGGKINRYICSDRTTFHRKIVIEYDHSNKDT